VRRRSSAAYRARIEPGFRSPTRLFIGFSRSKNSGFAFQKHGVWGGYLVYKPRWIGNPRISPRRAEHLVDLDTRSRFWGEVVLVFVHRCSSPGDTTISWLVPVLRGPLRRSSSVMKSSGSGGNPTCQIQGLWFRQCGLECTVPGSSGGEVRTWVRPHRSLCELVASATGYEVNRLRTGDSPAECSAGRMRG
jgi:hypothetical protein